MDHTPLLRLLRRGALGLASAVLALTMLPLQVGAAVTWNKQTSNTVNQLNGVNAVDTNDVWAVGDNGTILHTTNGGMTWTPQASGTANALAAVSFVDTSTGFAVGNGVKFLKTINGGATWVAKAVLPSGATAITGDISGVHFVNANFGWVVGQMSCTRGGFGIPCNLLVTSDGGATWAQQGLLSTFNHQWAVSSAPGDSANGFAAGNLGTIVHTANGGATWAGQTSNASSTLSGASAVDANHAWIVGLGAAIRATSNAGTTWKTQTACTSCVLPALNGVSFVDTMNGWTVGSSGSIFSTTNGGANWGPDSSGTTADLLGISCVDTTHCWAVGKVSGGAGTILSTVVNNPVVPEAPVALALPVLAVLALGGYLVLHRGPRGPTVGQA